MILQVQESVAAAAVGEEGGAEDETLLAEQRALEPQNASALTLSLLQVCRGGRLGGGAT